MINIKDIRFKNRKEKNPIILDYKIANELFLYALYKSYFRNNIVVSDDYRYLIDKQYPKGLVYLTFIVVKYKLNEESIREIVNALNIANKEIKISVDAIDTNEYENYHVTLNFYDNYQNSISRITYKFMTNYVAKSGLRDSKWFTLPLLKEKIYIPLESKELVLIRNVTSLLYENCFYLDAKVAKRINYLLTTHLSNIFINKSIDLETRFHNYKKDIYINDILDILDEKEIEQLLDKATIKTILNK